MTGPYNPPERQVERETMLAVLSSIPPGMDVPSVVWGAARAAFLLRVSPRGSARKETT